MGHIEVFAKPEVVIGSEAAVGEGPVWDHRTERLCWVDITKGLLFENDLVSREQRTSNLDMMVGAIAPRAEKEGFAVAVADGFGFWDHGELTIVDLVLPEYYRRMNDAKCDSSGRLWAGSTHMDLLPDAGFLHRWDGGSASMEIAGGFTLPNGIGWSPDDGVMYLVDSMKHQLLQAVYHAEEGEVEVFTQLCAIDSGLPDGLAIDADGCIWLAIWGGSEVRRYNPVGELVGIVPMPVSQPSSCAFGEDGTLFITSARAGLSIEELEQQPQAGSVFALSTTTRGVQVHPFKG